MFNAGGEVRLFDRLDFNAVMFGEVISGPDMPNLIYLTTFESMQVRNEKWKQFFSSADWKSIVDLPQYVNTVSKADIWLLYPTAYSDY